jgi:hypothetical protein
VARNQSYNNAARSSSNLRPVLSDAYESLVLSGRHAGNHWDVKILSGSRKTATRRIIASLRLPFWNLIKPALNFLIAIFISYRLGTHDLPPAQPDDSRLLMSEFNSPLMTSLPPMRDFVCTASA